MLFSFMVSRAWRCSLSHYCSFSLLKAVVSLLYVKLSCRLLNWTILQCYSMEMSLEWRKSCKSNNTDTGLQQSGQKESLNRPWPVGFSVIWVLGQVLLLPSHQCLSILEILMSCYLHIPFIKWAKVSYYNHGRQGTEMQSDFCRCCKSVLVPGTKPRSPEFQSIALHRSPSVLL